MKDRQFDVRLVDEDTLPVDDILGTITLKSPIDPAQTWVSGETKTFTLNFAIRCNKKCKITGTVSSGEKEADLAVEIDSGLSKKYTNHYDTTAGKTVPVRCVKIKSANSNGGAKERFAKGEPVYVTGSCYASTYPISVVEDTTWIDGMPIPPRVAGTATTVTTDSEGNIAYSDLPFVESSNATGGRKDIFDEGESVYAYGSNYDADTTYPIYVVEDTTWTDGMSIPSRVAETATTIATNSTGDIVNATTGTSPALIWASYVVGKYDIVVDVNANGLYDTNIDTRDDFDVNGAGFAEEGSSTIPAALIWPSADKIGKYDIVVDVDGDEIYDEISDPIDDMDVEDAGFEVIPEFTTIAIPVTAILGLLFLFSRRKRKE